MTRWTIFLLLTGFLLLGESSCIYEQYSTAIIRNNTNKPITITLHLDTATLKNHPNFYQIPRDAFENFKNVNKPSTIIFTIDSTNNLSGTTVLEPKQILRLYEGMSAKPTFFVDKIHISYSDKNIFLNNKTDIEKVFTEKDKGHYELEIK